jgi:small-conductance mechanosensitive channel
MSLQRKLGCLVVLGFATGIAGAATDSAQAAPTSKPDARGVMTGEQVVKILDGTVEWYRTLGLQQQSATQPSDLLILYANRQTADKVINLAFEIARANAELLSSEAEVAQTAASDAAASPQALVKQQQLLAAQRASIEAEIASIKREAATTQAQKDESQAKLSELQGELDLVNARRNMLDTMSQFAYQSDANGSGASALKEHIDAIAASIPSSTAGPAPANAVSSSAATTSNADSNAPLLSATSEGGARRLGIWDLSSNVLRLQNKIRTIEAIDQHTAALQDTFTQIRTPPLQRIKALSARGDALAQQADNAGRDALKDARNQFDTLAWLFKQTSAILIPLSQEGVLLTQYRHNLSSWLDATRTQYHDALIALARRVLLLLAMLAVVFGAAEIWRRAVFRYAQEARRRYQMLLVRKIVLWALVVAIIGFTFATELSSLATFAGLITAGLAVAMQSVLVSIVGYFFLIGKFGIRVGDRVQIGTVTGEVIELGLVRLHLMELSSGVGPLGPTGRVVAFANSIVFQTSGGIFKQIPGVNLAWHEITLVLPPDSDYTAIKEQLLQAANHVINDYREDISRQTKEIQKTTSSHAGGEVQTQIQLRFSSASVEALIRYPVQLQRAAEIDERVSRELLNVIKDAAAKQA